MCMKLETKTRGKIPSAAAHPQACPAGTTPKDSDLALDIQLTQGREQGQDERE